MPAMWSRCRHYDRHKFCRIFTLQVIITVCIMVAEYYYLSFKPAAQQFRILKPMNSDISVQDAKVHNIIDEESMNADMHDIKSVPSHYTQKNGNLTAGHMMHVVKQHLTESNHINNHGNRGTGVKDVDHMQQNVMQDIHQQIKHESELQRLTSNAELIQANARLQSRLQEYTEKMAGHFRQQEKQQSGPAQDFLQQRLVASAVGVVGQPALLADNQQPSVARKNDANLNPPAAVFAEHIVAHPPMPAPRQHSVQQPLIGDHMRMARVREPQEPPVAEVAVRHKDLRTLHYPDGLRLLQYREYNVFSGMSDAEAEINYYRFIEEIQVECTDFRMLGSLETGGWPACLAMPYKPQHPCLVYSFGINFDWTFDDDISDSYGCFVRSFDPSMRMQDHQHSPKVMFYNDGLGGHNGHNAQGMSVKTLQHYLQVHGETQATIDYLKIDIEYDEWASIECMLRDLTLTKVKQLGFEVHTRGYAQRALGTSEYVRFWSILKGLENLGFRKWYSRFNRYGMGYPGLGAGSDTGMPYTTCCYELVYVNLNFLEQSQSTGLPTEPITIPLMSNLNDIEVEKTFFSLVETTTTQCNQHILYGHHDDGGWDVCADRLRHGCIVYILDANNYGEGCCMAMMMNLIWHCQVHSFLLPNVRPRQSHRGKPGCVHSLGILNGQDTAAVKAGATQGFRDLVRAHNMGTETPVDVLKLDLDQQEWGVLAAMLNQRELDSVKQILLYVNIDSYTSAADYTSALEYSSSVLRALDRAGFKVWRSYGLKERTYVSPLTGITRSHQYVVNYINANLRT